MPQSSKITDFIAETLSRVRFNPIQPSNNSHLKQNGTNAIIRGKRYNNLYSRPARIDVHKARYFKIALLINRLLLYLCAEIVPVFCERVRYFELILIKK